MMAADGCPADEGCEAVDVALEVALEAAEAPDVREYIRRAQHARVAERDQHTDSEDSP